jgi:serine protease Do
MPQPDPWRDAVPRRGPRWLRRPLELGRAAAPALALALSLGLAAGCQRTVSGSAPETSVAPPMEGKVVPPLQAPIEVAPRPDIASLVERLKPTVVNITTSRRVSRAAPERPFFGGAPFGIEPGPPRLAPDEIPHATALGTGFVVDPSGYVVTNAHVVEDADDIKVRLSDEREFPAHLAGKDPKLDLALLKIDGATGLAAASLGDSDKLRVGESVLAIGNPFGLGHTVTLGIVSAKDRTIGAGPYDEFIQTDASINPGNSGGPLFNLRGEVTGISTAIRANAQGIGFAVPINALKDILPQLREKGSVSRGKLGVVIQELTPDLAAGLGIDRTRGALVGSVEPDSAASRAGIQAGDVITAVDGAAVIHSEELPRRVARHAPGSNVSLTLLRKGTTHTVDATLGALEEPRRADPAPAGGPDTAPPADRAPARLGVQLGASPSGRGALVLGVSQGGLAAGRLAPGDVIEEINRRTVASPDDVVAAVRGATPGQVLLLRVRNISAALRSGGQPAPQRFVAIRIR